jgi:hypothetical protein
MLAYLFWHRPSEGADIAEYERRLRAFHRVISGPSASFRVDPLPFAPEDGYEDWYLVRTWSALGSLNDAAVTGARSGPHEAVAALAGAGWGGVYRLLHGAAVPPSSVRWATKPSGVSYEDFVQTLSATTLWQRQMVLGPAPEFCLAEEGAADGARARSRTPIHLDK